MMTKRSEDVTPLLSFGMIADIHYADIDDGTNYTKTRKRYYRNSLSLLKTAVADWTATTENDGQKISFVLDLGDLVDGFNAPRKSSASALNAVTEAFDKTGVPVYHLLGNHDFYNFTRKELYSMPKMNPYVVGNFVQPNKTSDHAMYFDFELCPGFRLVVIDPYEVSMLGLDEDDEFYKRAEKILKKENKNEDLNSPVGLSSSKTQFVKFNGAVSEGQLKWLDSVLLKAQENKDVVLMAGHVPLKSPDTVCLCWNHDEVLNVLHRYTCVLMYFSGHAHDRLYCEDANGIHHFSVPGVIEAKPSVNAAHCTITLFKDRVVVNDVGAQNVYEFMIKRTQHR